MPSEKDNILKFNQYMKSDKIPYIIYADIEYLIKKKMYVLKNPEKSFTTKIGEYIPCAYLMQTIWAFDHIENKHALYRRKDCMKKYYSSLRDYATNILNFEKDKTLPLTKEVLTLHQDAINCYICEKGILKSLLKVKIIANLRIIATVQGNIDTQRIVFTT